MGAPSKGDAARTEVVTVRMTKAEKAELEALHKKAALGLRVLMKAAGIGAQK